MEKTGKIDAKEFWNRVDRMRNAKRLSLSDLQQIIGKTGTYVYVARCNEALPSVSVMIDMADVFGCSLDQLVGHSLTEQVEDSHSAEIIYRYKADARFRIVVDTLMNWDMKGPSATESSPDTKKVSA